jgi:uncharacterized membrane protein
MDPLHHVSHARLHIWNPTAFGDKAADAITGFVGSWLFVGIHAVWFLLWIISRIEPFPYGLLTLLVSLEAIFLSTFVMMSQNRSAARDHVRDDHEAEEVDMLFHINQTQLDILQLLREYAGVRDGAAPQHPEEEDGRGAPPAAPKAPASRTAPSSRSSRRRGR